MTSNSVLLSGETYEARELRSKILRVTENESAAREQERNVRGVQRMQTARTVARQMSFEQV